MQYYQIYMRAEIAEKVESSLEENAKLLGVNPDLIPAEGLVITGFGGKGPLGEPEEQFQAMLNGQSGVKAWDVHNFRTNIAAPVDFKPEDFYDNKQVRELSRITAMSGVYTRKAATMAGLLCDETGKIKCNIDKKQVAGWLSSGLGGSYNLMLIQHKLFEGTSELKDEEQRNEKIRHNSSRVLPYWTFQMFPHELATFPSVDLGYSGWCGSTVEACATGLSNIVELLRVIDEGRAQAGFGGGYEDLINKYNPHVPIDAIAIAAFAALRLPLSKGELGPEKTSRPFDILRDGFVLASGGGTVAAENVAFARERRAKVLAEVVNYCKKSDGSSQTDLDPASVAETIFKAIWDRKLRKFMKPDLILTHATSTKQGDWGEGKALHLVFGKELKDIPIAAIKSNLGHMIGGAGAMNFITALQCMSEGKVPHILNLENPRLNLENLSVEDDEASKYMNYTIGKPYEGPINSVLILGYGFGGSNAAVMIRKPRPEYLWV